MKQKIVLIEGGEGSGKTTLAKYLEKNYGFKYIKLPTPGSEYEKIIFSDLKDNYVRAVVASRDMEARFDEVKHFSRIVFDRGPLSTFAYQGTDEAFTALRTFGSNIVSKITDVLILDVDTEIGLSREVYKNAVSNKGLHFHMNINRRMREIGYHLEDIARDHGNIDKAFDIHYGDEDVLKASLRTLFSGIENAHIIDVNKTTAEEGIKLCIKALKL